MSDSMSLPFTIPQATPAGRLAFYLQGKQGEISYVKLLADVKSAQERLLLTGLRQGDLVGIVGENSYEWIAYDLAIMTMGCVSINFPEAYLCAEDVDDIADSYELSLLLISRRSDPQGRSWIMALDLEGQLIGKSRRVTSSGTLHGLRQDRDMCGVIFSSGSSGKLKAITLSRRGVESVLDAFTSAWEIGEGDRIFVGLPVSIFQQRILIYSALRSGADICFTEPHLLFRGLKRLKPTIVLAPPSLFETIEDRGKGDPAAAFGGQTRLLLTGSAPSRLSTLAFYARAGIPLYQIYGMAEVGFVAWNLPHANRNLTVGRPVVPNSVEIAPDGEVIIDLPSRQAIGYFGVSSAEEMEVFISDCKVATGDIGMIDADGYLSILGRKRNVIITRSGEKFSVEQIEAGLQAVEGVKHAVVLGGGEIPLPVAVVAINPSLDVSAEMHIVTLVRKVLEDHNSAARTDVKINDVVVTRVQFDTANGLLTRNLKVDRTNVVNKFVLKSTELSP